MIVGANDMKTMVAGPPPKTRISTPAEAKAAQAAPAKKSPVMAIAAGVVVLALAGGGYAMFGGKSAANTPADTSHTSTQANTPAQESTPPAVTPTTTPQQQQQTNPLSRPTTQSPPPSTQTNTRPNHPGISMDPIDVRQDLGRMIDASDGAAKATLEGFIAKTQQYYRNRDLPNALRAQAAAYLSQFYLEEAKQEKAAGNAGEEGRLRSAGKDWARNAADMDSKWQSLLNLFE